MLLMLPIVIDHVTDLSASQCDVTHVTELSETFLRAIQTMRYAHIFNPTKVCQNSVT